MTTLLLKEAGVDVAAFLEVFHVILIQIYSFKKSESLVVTEADEYDRSFLTLHPWLAVVTGCRCRPSMGPPVIEA